MYKFNTFKSCVKVSQIQFFLIPKYQELKHSCSPGKDYPATFLHQYQLEPFLKHSDITSMPVPYLYCEDNFRDILHAL